MAKSFRQMNKEELIKATESLGLMGRVKEVANDVENITNVEYVTVLEEFKAQQDGINADTKAELDKIKSLPEVPVSDALVHGKKVDAYERAALKQIKYKYIVTDHHNRQQIDDDDINRVFPIQYGNLNSGPKTWQVALHGREQALPFSVARKLEEIKMVVPSKDAEGNPIMITQPRFRVTKIDGWTQEEIDQLKRTQNTRKFKD